MHALGFHPHEAGSENCLGASKALASKSDYLAVGQLIRHVALARGVCPYHLCVEVFCNIAALLLDVTDYLPLSGSGQERATLGHDLHQIVCEVPACVVGSRDRMRHCVALVNGHHMGDTIAAVTDNACCPPRCVQRQHSLRRNIHGRNIEGLEHDLCHLLSVGLGVQRGLREQHGVLIGHHVEAVVECVAPDPLHVIPVLHHPMQDGVSHLEDAPLLLTSLTDIHVLVLSATHDVGSLRPPYDRREDTARSILAREACLAVATPNIDHECCLEAAARCGHATP
mmetsp:Transcript_56970/g.132840  ORF Transcript_56970/g.132840 Transcript_56970/m.132840 type:complete len:283 (+) Transcript_56970:444-1292(+)